MIKLTEGFGERLEKAIKDNKSSNYKLAKALKVSLSTIANYISGKVKRPDRTKVVAIANHLKVNFYWLTLGEADNEVKEPENEGISNSNENNDIPHQILLTLEAMNKQFFELRNSINNMNKKLTEFTEKSGKK